MLQERRRARIRRMTVWAVAALAFMPLMFILPMNVSAATSYYFSYGPSANNATLEKTYERYSYGPASLSSIMVLNDTSWYTVYEHDVEELYPIIDIDVNDWTDPDWMAYDPAPDGVIGTMPPDNGTATILSVKMFVRMTYPNCPFGIKYSIDDRATWSNTTLFDTGEYYGTWQLDVTDDEVWTPAILNSNDLWIHMDLYPLEDVTSYIDYVGWYVQFSVPYAGGASSSTWGDFWDRTDEAASPGWDFLYETNGVVSILGLFGLVGMVAAPPLAIFIARHSNEGKMNIFVKMLAFFMFCLTAFLYSATVA